MSALMSCALDQEDWVSDVLLAAPPIATDIPCAAHGSHRPEPAYREQHHVIPQAWQHAWHPGDIKGSAVAVGVVVVLHTSLFDPRTVALCRTGHGNVHVWIVRYMREYQAQTNVEAPSSADAQLIVVKAVSKQVVERSRSIHEPFRNLREMVIALDALNRWVIAGGSLRDLCDAKLFGEI